MFNGVFYYLTFKMLWGSYLICSETINPSTLIEVIMGAYPCPYIRSNNPFSSPFKLVSDSEPIFNSKMKSNVAH